MIFENPISMMADRAVAERRELIRRCAASVMQEVEAGRAVDPLRVQWAQSVISSTPELLAPLSDGRPA